MPILITGGTGFLGVNLVRLLTSRGERVRLLVRERSGRLGLESDLIEFRRGDVTDAASIADAMRGCDQVYHLAGWVRLTPWGFKEAYRINVEGTANVCRAALSQGVRRLVHTSSIATIGCGTLDAPADETTGKGVNPTAKAMGHPPPDPFSAPYYRTKCEAERVVLSHVNQGLDAVIVNPTYVVGPWDVKPTAGRMVIQVATGRQRVYPRRGGINFVDARQAALGHVLAMKRGRAGERYILGGENLTYRAFFERVATIAGVPPPRWGIGYHTLALPAAMGSLAGRVFAKTFRDKNLCVLRSGFVEHFVTQDKARRELGIESIPIDDAIRAALAWFVEYGYIKWRGTFDPGGSSGAAAPPPGIPPPIRRLRTRWLRRRSPGPRGMS